VGQCDAARTAPRPPDDTPQGRAVRDQAALTTFVTLEPVNYNEAEIALQHICLLAHAADSRRMADQYAADLRIAHKLCRQAESMERLARALLKDLAENTDDAPEAAGEPCHPRARRQDRARVAPRDDRSAATSAAWTEGARATSGRATDGCSPAAPARSVEQAGSSRGHYVDLAGTVFNRTIHRQPNDPLTTELIH
jgi:hypothetical protein